MDCALEEGLAGLAGRHAVVVPRRNVPTHQAQPLGHGVQHVLALDLRIFPDSRRTVLVTLRSGAAGGTQRTGAGAVKARGVEAVGVAVHRGRVGARGVAGATGGVMVQTVSQGGGTRRLSLYIRGRTVGLKVALLTGHSAEKPEGVRTGAK